MQFDEMLDVVGILSSGVDEGVEEDLGASVTDEDSRPMICVSCLQHLDDAADESTDRSTTFLLLHGRQHGRDGGNVLHRCHGRRRLPR